jgi:hypothetical protein
MKKTCKRCNKSKDVVEFYRNKKCADGIHVWCKECCKEYERERNKKRTQDRAWSRKTRLERLKAEMRNEEYMENATEYLAGLIAKEIVCPDD